MPSYDNDREVVLVAAIFGANASGKSNLLDGLRLISTMVRGWETREPRSGIPRNPSRLEPKSLLEPSSFAVELILDGVHHTYGSQSMTSESPASGCTAILAVADACYSTGRASQSTSGHPCGAPVRRSSKTS